MSYVSLIPSTGWNEIKFDLKILGRPVLFQNSIDLTHLPTWTLHSNTVKQMMHYNLW
jgi:hypothetical protein